MSRTEFAADSNGKFGARWMHRMHAVEWHWNGQAGTCWLLSARFEAAQRSRHAEMEAYGWRGLPWEPFLKLGHSAGTTGGSADWPVLANSSLDVQFEICSAMLDLRGLPR